MSSKQAILVRMRVQKCITGIKSCKGDNYTTNNDVSATVNFDSQTSENCLVAVTNGRGTSATAECM